MATKYALNEASDFLIKNAKEANPQQIGETLARITAANDGRLTPIKVIEAARPQRSPLHRHFDWEDAEAAHQWRLHQARHLVSAIRIVSDDNEQSLTRAYVSIHADGATSYRTVTDIMNNATLQDLLLRQADRELAQFEKRYHELMDICELVREARQRISIRQTQRRGDQPQPQPGA